MLDDVNDFITGLADQPWVYFAVFALCALDAFFPPLPSESVVVSLAVLSLGGAPNVWWLGVMAASGAFIGDNIAYQIGQSVGVDRFGWQRTARVHKMVGWARRQLETRGGLLIIAGRYVPIGRIAINMTAGATRYPRRTFMAFDIVAGVSWAAWSIIVGRLAGHWVDDNPVLGAAIAIVIAVLIGTAIDHLIRRFTSGRRDDKPESELLREGRP